ncbi:MAG: 50S ribosomal protein L37ae [Nanoarchaeota archaeon]
MAVKTKKIKSAGRFGAGYGKPKLRLVAVEQIQRKRQECPFCRGKTIRLAKSIWNCEKCGKKFTAGVYTNKLK